LFGAVTDSADEVLLSTETALRFCFCYDVFCICFLGSRVFGQYLGCLGVLQDWIICSLSNVLQGCEDKQVSCCLAFVAYFSDLLQEGLENVFCCIFILTLYSSISMFRFFFILSKRFLFRLVVFSVLYFALDATIIFFICM
jgi:hypothetical protein